MTATLSPDRADAARPMILMPVPDGSGGYRHEFRPAPAEKPKGRKKRIVPDPIKANPEAAAQQLARFIESIERLREEKRAIAEDERDIFAEAKADGFDTKGMRAILRIRELDPATRLETEGIIETYKCSLGIE